MLIRASATVLLCLLMLGGLAGSGLAQSGTETADLTIFASNCPDDAYDERDFDSGKCSPGTGITFNLVTESGSSLGSCVATEPLNEGTAAGCLISGVPYETNVIAFQDLSTLPAGVEPEEGNSVAIYTSIPTSAAVLTVGFYNRLITNTVATSEPTEATATVGSSLCPARGTPTNGGTPLSSCTPGAGITIVGSLEGEPFGSCVTSGEVATPSDGSYASCEIVLPSDFPPETRIVFAEDATTVPSGYESSYPIGSTIGTSAAYPDSAVLFYHRAVEAGDQVQATEPSQSPVEQPQSSADPTLPAETTDRPAQSASAAAVGSSARIQAGTCEDMTPGESVAELADVIAPTGDPRGATGASSVETSFTTVDLLLDDILAQDHVIVVFDEDDSDVALTCGEIGGVVANDGSLAIGLRAQGDSRFSGVAYLAPSGEETAVSIFLAEDLAGEQEAR